MYLCELSALQNCLYPSRESDRKKRNMLTNQSVEADNMRSPHLEAHTSYLMGIVAVEFTVLLIV